jgi:hypothetical protein
MEEIVKCKTCDKDVSKEKAWTLYGRDYENPICFCTDSCRVIFPFKKND